MAARAVSLVAGLGLVVLVSAPVAAQAVITLEVAGPTGVTFQGGPDYTLEAAGKAWKIDQTDWSLPAVVDVSGPVVVRLRLLSNCRPLVRFVAQPGSSYIIRRLADGSFRVEDWTRQGLDMVGGMPPPTTPVCPSLPDTATIGPSHAIDADRGAAPASVAVLGIAFATGLLVALRRMTRRPAGGDRADPTSL